MIFYSLEKPVIASCYMLHIVDNREVITVWRREGDSNPR